MCSTALARLALTSSTGAPGAARRFVRARLGPSHGDAAGDAVDVAELLVTEVVTNAVVHGAPPLVLELECDDVRVRVRVDDASSSLPAPRRASDEDQGGRGLVLVDVLSAAWGVETAATGKRVWFTVDLAG